jgi:MFS family permease
VTGIQGAITAYTLVMAALMITGAKIGAIIGRKRAFAIGCVIYGCGSFTTSIAPSLPVLLFGWSFLEGVGAALILPAIVALVAGNFRGARRRPRTAWSRPPGAIAVAVGPLIGGFCTTTSPGAGSSPARSSSSSILLLTRRIADAPPESGRSSTSSARCSPRSGSRCSSSGAALERVGLDPAEGRRRRLVGPLADVWLVLGGLFVLWLLPLGGLREKHGEEPLVRPAMLRNKQLSGGLIDVLLPVPRPGRALLRRPALPSVCLGLSALATGARLPPLSITPARGRDRDPALCRTILAALVSARPARAARRDRRPAGRARPDSGPEIVCCRCC